MANSVDTTNPTGANAIIQRAAMDEISSSFGLIKLGLDMIREAAHRIEGNPELEDRLVFLADACVHLAEQGDAAFDRAEHIAEWVRLTEEKTAVATCDGSLSDGRKAGMQHQPRGSNAAGA